METEFKHSIKVPVQYKKAAKVLKNSMESGASIKGQIFAEKHAVNINPKDSGLLPYRTDCQ